MPDQFFSPEGDLEDYFVSEYWLIDQYTSDQLWTWGDATYGQLGDNNSNDKLSPTTTFSGGTDWKQVSAGNKHTAAIKSDGTLWTWGSGFNGQLGNAVTTSFTRTPITTFSGGTNWKQVSTGSNHTAAIKTDGTLWTWGSGGGGFAGYNTLKVRVDSPRYGKLGNADITFRSTPVTTFAGGANWKQVSAGDEHTAAVKTDGTLWIWGVGSSGRLGNLIITGTISTPITTFAGGNDWKQVDAGFNHTKAIKTDGTLWVWGNGFYGQLGNNDTTNKSTPVTTFTGGTNWKQVSGHIGRSVTSTGLADYFSYAAAIKTDGTLWTWGSSYYPDRLARAISTNVVTPVTTFAGGTNWVDTPTTNPEDLYTLSAGVLFSAAIKTDGTLWTWGDNEKGKLGTYITGIQNFDYGRYIPVTTFAGGTNWKQIKLSSPSFYNSKAIAIKTDGTLWTWGYGSRFANTTLLGNAITTLSVTISTPITTFAGGTNWADTATGVAEELYTLSAGNDHVAAIKTDGTLWVWGDTDFGKLGIGEYPNTKYSRSTPVTTFAGGNDWKQVDAGYSHTAAVKTDGTLWTWGRGTYGRLGNASGPIVTSTPITTFAGGTDWKQVSGGGSHTAAIKTDGTLWTWGYASSGQLGNANLTDRSTPITTFAGGTDWKQVSGGGGHTAAIKTDGTLWTWGFIDSGRLGNGETTITNKSTPVTTFAGGTNWKQVSSGTAHTAAIKTDGTLWTWGGGNNGRLGNGETTGKISTPVTTFAGGTDWTEVHTGNQNTAAIKTDGTLWIWGSNISGQLGNSTASNSSTSTPVTTFAGGTNWKQVSGGGSHTIALNDDGVNKRLFVWGANYRGQLGNSIYSGENTYDRNTPITTFAGGTDWKQASCSELTSAAIKTDGTLWMWGHNFYGQLGNKDIIDVNTPITTFAGGTNWKQVSCGTFYTAAIKTDGTLWAWGNGSDGRLGTLSINIRLTPITTFAGGTNWADTPTTNSEDLHTITAGIIGAAAIKTDGTLWTWGGGGSGNPGNGITTGKVSTPITTFAGGTNWRQVCGGFRFTAAIKTDGTLWSWGNGIRGQLGNTGVTDRSTPVTTFSGGTNWKQVSCDNYSTVAIKTDGTLWTWGYGSQGRLGNARTTTNNSTPSTTFAGGTDWKQVSVRAAIKTDGTLWLWGPGSDGQLGNTTTISTNSTPVTTFAGGTNWKQVSTGGFHTAAIKTDGTLWVWGWGGYGQLGNGTTSSIGISTPVTTFAGGTNWKQVSSGGSHTAAIKTDGTLWTWGNGYYGVLGVNDVTSRSTPVTTFIGGTNWKQVHTGNRSSSVVALRDDGINKQLYIWGGGYYGQLGNGMDVGAYETYRYPIQVHGWTTDWKQVDCSYAFSAAIKTDGTLWAWGNGSYGRLGNASGPIVTSTPVTTFAGGTNWKQVSSGSAHTAAIKTDGTLWAWGLGTSGQLGNAVSTGTISTPVTTFAGGTNWKQVSAGWDHTIALNDDGVNKRLFVWGLDDSGQLGIGDGQSLIPGNVFGNSTNWKQVNIGPTHAAAVKIDGTLWTWGSGNSGVLGNSQNTLRSTPVTTRAGGTDWKQVSCGYDHTVAVTNNIDFETQLS